MIVKVMMMVGIGDLKVHMGSRSEWGLGISHVYAGFWVYYKGWRSISENAY
jgi:hypothetical protein